MIRRSRERTMSIRKNRTHDFASSPPEPVAGNGLLHRRALLERGVMLAGAVATGAGSQLASASAEPLTNGSLEPRARGAHPPLWPAVEIRAEGGAHAQQPQARARTSGARTPHHLLNGTITPNGLHFVVARGGETEIDPDKHRLLIHGLVRQPMIYTVDALHRYPMVSRISFVECGGNSAPLYSKEPIQGNVQALHGLCSCAEWTGVALATLLDEVGVDPKAKWFIAEGADLPTMNKSIPLAKAMDDAMIALYQNGEAINPSNGYPMRLLLPGYEGNMNVKWLRRIKLVDSPVMAINETKQYTILRPDGKAWQFYFPQEVKSFITHPSPGLASRDRAFTRFPASRFQAMVGSARSRSRPTAARVGP